MSLGVGLCQLVKNLWYTVCTSSARCTSLERSQQLDIRTNLKTAKGRGSSNSSAHSRMRSLPPSTPSRDKVQKKVRQIKKFATSFYICEVRKLIISSENCSFRTLISLARSISKQYRCKFIFGLYIVAIYVSRFTN